MLRILISRRQTFWLITSVAKELVLLTPLHPGVTVRLDPATARLNVKCSDNTPRCVQNRNLRKEKILHRARISRCDRINAQQDCITKHLLYGINIRLVPDKDRYAFLLGTCIHYIHCILWFKNNER